jgi:hypothetical protein
MDMLERILVCLFFFFHLASLTMHCAQIFQVSTSICKRRIEEARVSLFSFFWWSKSANFSTQYQGTCYWKRAKLKQLDIFCINLKSLTKSETLTLLKDNFILFFINKLFFCWGHFIKRVLISNVLYWSTLYVDFNKKLLLKRFLAWWCHLRFVHSHVTCNKVKTRRGWLAEPLLTP